MKHALYATVASLVMLTSANANVSQFQKSPESLIQFVFEQFRSDDVDINQFSHERHPEIFTGPYLRTIEIHNAVRERGIHCLHYHIELGDYIYDPADVRGNVLTELIRKYDQSAVVRTTFYRDFPYNVDWFLEKHNDLWYIVDAEAEKYYGRFSELCDHFSMVLDINVKEKQNNPEDVIAYIYGYYQDEFAYSDLMPSKEIFKGNYREILDRINEYYDSMEISNDMNHRCWDQSFLIGEYIANMDEITRTIRYETDIKAEDTAVVTVSLYEGDGQYIANWFLKQYDGAWYVVDLKDQKTGELFSEQCALN